MILQTPQELAAMLDKASRVSRMEWADAAACAFLVFAAVCWLAFWGQVL